MERYAIYMIISFIAGFIINELFSRFFKYKSRHGVIEIDTSKPDNEKYLFFIEVPLSKLPKLKKVIFDVINK